jgi:hypothetical protein
MKQIMRLTLATDDTNYASAFAETVAATQRGLSVSVTGYEARPEAGDGFVLLVDTEGAGGASCTAADAAAGVDGSSGAVAGATACADTALGEDAAAGGDAASRGPVLEIWAGRCDDPHTVDKYAGCSRICAEVRAACAAARGPLGFAGAEACGGIPCLISFAGLEGGAGVSSLALGFAAELSAYRGKKVLYLSFETIESPLLGAGGRMTPRGDMSAFLFAFLRAGKEGRGAEVSAAPYIARDDYGVMRFTPTRGLNRLRELGGEELARFLKAVTGETAPDVVVADWGGGFGEVAAGYMRASAYTVFVARRDGTKVRDDGDGASLFSVAEDLGVERSRAIAVMGRAPAAEIAGSVDDAADAADASRSATPEDGRTAFLEICEDPYAFDRDEGRVTLSLATSFGTGVKRLADLALGGGEETLAAGAAGDALFPEAA